MARSRRDDFGQAASDAPSLTQTYVRFSGQVGGDGQADVSPDHILLLVHVHLATAPVAAAKKKVEDGKNSGSIEVDKPQNIGY